MCLPACLCVCVPLCEKKHGSDSVITPMTHMAQKHHMVNDRIYIAVHKKTIAYKLTCMRWFGSLVVWLDAKINGHLLKS